MSAPAMGKVFTTTTSATIRRPALRKTNQLARTRSSETAKINLNPPSSVKARARPHAAPRAGKKRDALCGAFPTAGTLASADVAPHIHGKKTDFPGISPDTLRKLQARAKLRAGGGRPYAKAPLAFPAHAREFFCDVEIHPMLDLCYLHGFVVRENGDNATERCVQFFTDEPTPQAEEEAFRKAWAFSRDRQPCALYYYSPYERTTLAALARKFPAVCSEKEVRALFAAGDTVDLYHDAVRPHTEWPAVDFSVKTLAEYLGFSWRDPHPSGAASVP